MQRVKSTGDADVDLGSAAYARPNLDTTAFSNAIALSNASGNDDALGNDNALGTGHAHTEPDRDGDT